MQNPQMGPPSPFAASGADFLEDNDAQEDAMNLSERITIEPGKCGGRPCIRGLRIRVKDVLGLLAAGASHQEILEDYPDLEEADILAALRYAAEQSDHLILRAA